MSRTDQPVSEQIIPSPETSPVAPANTFSDFAYNLRLHGAGSERFYSDVSIFSSRVLAEIERRAAPALDGYSQYLKDSLLEAPRSRGEYALELLTVGVAIRLYGQLAASTPEWVLGVARRLYCMRRRSGRLKPVADFMRAGLFQFFMRRKLHSGAAHHSNVATVGWSVYDRLSRLIEWLQATGEFEQEWRRIDNWRRFWCHPAINDGPQWVCVAVELFDWFTRESQVALGKYTSGVVPFLEKTWSKRFWREDQIFCGRLPVEYHLGMVAAEVMNEGLRDEFYTRPRKVVLVPGCLRGPRAETCKAVTKGLDIRCAGCRPDCAVNQITRRMRREGIEVYIVPHSSGFGRWLERWQNDPTVGVAAVACMMNILAGGYEMRARRIASQCVPLDFPACQKHWREQPVATGVNQDRLVQIVRGQP